MLSSCLATSSELLTGLLTHKQMKSPTIVSFKWPSLLKMSCLSTTLRVIVTTYSNWLIGSIFCLLSLTVICGISPICLNVSFFSGIRKKMFYIFKDITFIFFFSSRVQFSCSLLKLLIIFIKSIALLDSGLTVLIMVVLIILVNAIVPSQKLANFTMQICTEYSVAWEQHFTVAVLKVYSSRWI